MTLGQKIKYLRSQLGMTQDQLAQVTGIHPVSIRKYETDKTKPQPAQIERLASALGVGCFALSDLNRDNVHIETVGDLLGLVITLCDAGILQITGNRDADNMITPDTAKIQFNPKIAPFLKMHGMIVFDQDDNNCVSDYAMPLPILHNLLIWEKVNFMYQRSLETAGSNPDEATKAVLKSFEETKCHIELELQKSQILLKLK